MIFAGSRDDVPALLKAMDIFVFPTFNEAFGLCVLEAMDAGLPVVATNDAAVPEIISEGKDGLLIPPGDEQAVVAAVTRLLSDRALTARLAAGAQVRAREFSLEKMAGRYEALYERLLRK